MVEIIVAVAVTLVLTAAVVWPCAIGYRKKVVEAKIGNAEDRAREIIDEALKTAETKKREALLEAKEESMKTKNELDKETKERRAELQRYAVYFRRKKPWIRRRKPSNGGKRDLLYGKSSLRKNVQK